jgi:hypothetical protein
VNPGFSFLILMALVVVFGASVAMYALLVRRWTTRRNWVSLTEWAWERRMKLAKDLSQLPPPIDRLAERGAIVRLRVDDPRTATMVVQFQTEAHSTTATARAAGEADHPCWNVLIRRLSRPHAPAALRPTHAASSAVELFRLAPFHGLSNDRFVVLAVDGRTASKLARSSARALLPADVGLLLHDDWIMLDFSARPFDPIELDRMLSVAEQVAAAV